MKARELLLHIGQAKTATTSLQLALKEARDALRTQDILFPDIYPHWGNAEIMGYLFFDRQHVEWWREGWLEGGYTEIRAKAAHHWNMIRQDVAATGPDTLIISSESFFRPTQPAALRQANTLFAEVADTRKIVAYLRRPDTYFLSRMQQRLKTFMTTEHGSHTRLRDVIEPIQKYWDGSVALNVYDPSVMHDGDIFTDFMTRHLPQVDPTQLPRQLMQANTSLSAEAMAILFDITTGQQELRVKRKRVLQEILRGDAQIENPTRPRLKPQVAQSMINWSAPDLFWLHDTQGLTFPDIDYDAINPEDVHYEFLQMTNIHEICEVNMGRKQALLDRALRRARLPRQVRRWLAKR